ncbi:hypothetical protein OEZ86_012632 [Tetradesmus obliquus]|nr:hypothetical protein OEZ86_012632 [Tetradesmus obliquus]
MYKERTEALEKYFTEPDSEEAQAVARDIKEGVMKEQETVGLVGALLLSIAANVVFTVPDTILSITGPLAPLRDLYMICSTYAFGAEATATCLSVLLILQLNAQHSQHAYRSLVRFLRSFWPLCGLTSILAATGLLGLSGTVVLYCCAGYMAGSFTLTVPVLVGLATVAAYLLAAMIMLKMLMAALRSSKETALL